MATIVGAPAGAGQSPRWARPVRLTALHREHLAREADLGERDGWLLPRSYGDVAAERAVLREAVGLLDIGERGKIDLKSDDLEEALGAAFPPAPAAPSGGRVEMGIASSAAPVSAGDAPVVYRLTGEQALILTAPDALRGTLDALGRVAAARRCTHVTDVTGALCAVRLLGPRAPAVLERLTSLDLAPDRCADGAVAQGAVARVHALVARRDAAGLTGYDLYVDRDLGAYLWDALLDQGAALGLAPVGRDAAREVE